ncbi:hypothetical protein FRC08_017683, partial [Ceratobasidium sp. 394]
GTKKWDGTVESATLRALTATSFISTVIAATSPILVSLIAYHIAYLWVTEQQDNHSRQDTGPTPLQYGLMLQVLSASSIVSLHDAMRYLYKGKRRPRVPYYFTTAVVMGIVVYVVTHLIGLADLWLHATTSAGLHNVTSTVSKSEPLWASLEFNQTYCEDFDFPPERGICMARLGGWARNFPWLLDAGESVVSNSSLDRITITLADFNNMAVTVPLTVNKLARFKSTTFGMRARCESLNSRCDHEGRTILANCSSLGITAIPNQDAAILSVALVSPVHKWDGPPISSSDSTMREGILECCSPNPIPSILQLRWSTQNNAGYLAPNPAVDVYPFTTMTVFASCSIEVFNVTLLYDGTAGSKAWVLDPGETVLSEPRFATALIAPYSWQMVTDRLTTGIRARAVTARTADEVMASLNQELGRLALGFVSGSFVFAPAADVQILTPTILGRYPLAPLLAFTGLLALYGLIALVVFAMSTNATSSLVHVP